MLTALTAVIKSDRTYQVSDLVWHQLWINILTPIHSLTQTTPKCVLGLRPFDIWLDGIILLGDITWNRQSRWIKLFYVSLLNKATVVLHVALDTSEDTEWQKQFPSLPGEPCHKQTWLCVRHIVCEESWKWHKWAVEHPILQACGH